MIYREIIKELGPIILALGELWLKQKAQEAGEGFDQDRQQFEMEMERERLALEQERIRLAREKLQLNLERQRFEQEKWRERQKNAEDEEAKQQAKEKADEYEREANETAEDLKQADALLQTTGEFEDAIRTGDEDKIKEVMNSLVLYDD